MAFVIGMNFSRSPEPSEISKILPFPVENPAPPLSIYIDGNDTGILYRKYYSMVYRLCLDMLGNREDARDAAHNVFKNVLERQTNGPSDIASPKSYFSTVAHNMSVNEIKKARRELNTIYKMAANNNLERFMEKGGQEQGKLELVFMDKGYDQVEARIIVKSILDEQDETTRKIYFYKYHDDLTLEQIGEFVGLKKSAVHKRIKALEKQVKLKMGRAAK